MRIMFGVGDVFAVGLFAVATLILLLRLCVGVDVLETLHFT